MGSVPVGGVRCAHARHPRLDAASRAHVEGAMYKSRMQRSHTNSLGERDLQPTAGKPARCAPHLGYGILFIALLLFGVSQAMAHEYTAGGITVAHPWARATPGGAKVGGAYLEIKAAAGTSDRLVAVKTPAAGAAELHNHIMEKGIARMRRVEAIVVPAGKSVVLEPGGYHLMLTDLKAPLKQGDLLKLTLVFEKAGEIEVEATVEPLGAMGPHGFDRQPGAPAASGAHKH
jgi:periplasmic copper chaperone A